MGYREFGNRTTVGVNASFRVVQGNVNLDFEKSILIVFSTFAQVNITNRTS
jgi:hypothetical protein